MLFIFQSHRAEGQRRRFLLVAGLGYQLLGVILETGGCTASPGGNVTPDPFYVDQALFTLEHLSEMGIDLVCEKWLTLPQNPSLIDIDNVISMSSAKVKKSESAMGKEAISDAGIVLKRTKSLDLYDSSSESENSPLPHALHEKSSDNNSYEMSTAFRGEVGKIISMILIMIKHQYFLSCQGSTSESVRGCRKEPL